MQAEAHNSILVLILDEYTTTVLPLHSKSTIAISGNITIDQYRV